MKHLDYKSVINILLNFTDSLYEDNFIFKSGKILIYQNGILNHKAKEMFKQLNISDKQSDELMLREFVSRITYLSFPCDNNYNPENYHKKLIELGHTSPFYVNETVFGFFGISIETVLEIVSSFTNSSGRLTTSKTKAMLEPFYNVNNIKEREYIKEFIKIRKKFLKNNENIKDYEILNRFNLSIRAGFLVSSMKDEEWKIIYNSRLKDDTEYETKECYQFVKDTIKL